MYALQHLGSLVWKQAQSTLKILFPLVGSEGYADVAAESCMSFIVDLLAGYVEVAQVSFERDAFVVVTVVDGPNSHVMYAPWCAVFEVVTEDELADVIRKREEVKSVVALFWARLKRVGFRDRYVQSTIHVTLCVGKRIEVQSCQFAGKL